MKGQRSEAWIRVGYKLLGTEGLDGINVERLARILHLNKSGFYHYFGSMKSYIDELLEYHIGQARIIATEMETCKKIDPDLLLLIVKYKRFFLVESHLLLRSRSFLISKDFDEAGKIVSERFLDLWRKAKDLPDEKHVSLAYLNILRHFFYARINSENIHYEFLHRFILETREALNKGG